LSALHTSPGAPERRLGIRDRKEAAERSVVGEEVQGKAGYGDEGRHEGASRVTSQMKQVTMKVLARAAAGPARAIISRLEMPAGRLQRAQAGYPELRAAK
jgi:hypothetical protein